jgi:ketopantoate reductase
MRICIFGAGSVGGYLAGYLAQGGADVSVVARGVHLAAIRARGLTVERLTTRSLSAWAPVISRRISARRMQLS